MLTLKGNESQKLNCWLQINIYLNFQPFHQPALNSLISTLSHCYLWAKRSICLQMKKKTHKTFPSFKFLPPSARQNAQLADFEVRLQGMFM